MFPYDNVVKLVICFADDNVVKPTMIMWLGATKVWLDNATRLSMFRACQLLANDDFDTLARSSAMMTLLTVPEN